MSFEEEQILKESGDLSPHVCVSAGKAQVTRCHQLAHPFSMQAFACTAGHIASITHTGWLAGHSSSITATLHRQSNWPPAPAAINQHAPRGRTNHRMHAHKSMTYVNVYVCGRSCMCLSSAINILRLILWPRPCVGALQGHHPAPGLDLRVKRGEPESSRGNTAHLSNNRQRLKEEAPLLRETNGKILCRCSRREIWVWASNQLNCCKQRKEKKRRKRRKH